ncbi:MAG TPA: hypothetical protein DIW47_11970 [Bacteroidetes bacterium]|nr:hypothetical protein [Bacteroidota bacterium]
MTEEWDVFYTKSSIRNPAIAYIYPNENSEVVPKCFHGTYSFKISFLADEAVELEELVLNIRDVEKGYPVLNWKLSEFPDNMYSFSTKQGVQYCVFIEFKWIEKEICDFDIDNRYELFFTYGNREISMPRALAVRFSSFDDKYKYLDCDCN